MVPQVLYPAVQLPSDEGLRALCIQWQSEVSLELGTFMRSGPLFVSINRFERKKVSSTVIQHLVQSCAVQYTISWLLVAIKLVIHADRGVCMLDLMCCHCCNCSMPVPPGLPQLRPMQLQVHPANVQGLPLAVKALHELKRQGHLGASLARLVVAGGYDKRLAENREHFKEVQHLVTDLHMEDEVCLFAVIINSGCTWCHP